MAGGDLSTEEVIWVGYYNYSLYSQWKYWGTRITEADAVIWYCALKIRFRYRGI